MNKFHVKNNNLPNKDIFKSSNDGKSFISIDMRKANFSSLQHYDSSIFASASTWEDFIRMYTNNLHIILIYLQNTVLGITLMEYIRQVILGNCNPKRHITYEKYLMDQILSGIEKYNLYDKVVFFSNDEIVFEMDSSIKTETLLYMGNCLTEDIETGFNIPVRVELFTLHKINGTDGYYKEIVGENGTVNIEFKCLDNYMLPFVLRKFSGEEITKSDKIFYHEGLLSEFIEVPDIEVRFNER